MVKNAEKPGLIVAISSSALFDLHEGHDIFLKQGVAAYCKYQIKNENKILKPGTAYALTTKLLALNDNNHNHGSIDVVLISRNSADTGLRIFNSINHYELAIKRAAFTSGRSPFQYVEPFQANIFLTTEPSDVQAALQAGIASATILSSETSGSVKGELRIAFDGDSVIFSDESEQIFQKEGLEAFSKNELNEAKKLLPGGPFRNFLQILHDIQSSYSEVESPIRTALFTARAAPAHERVIRTLRAWDIRIDEAVFLGGLDKGDFLKTFGADIFFDDQISHCDSTRQHVPTGHVPTTTD